MLSSVEKIDTTNYLTLNKLELSAKKEKKKTGFWPFYNLNLEYWTIQNYSFQFIVFANA